MESGWRGESEKEGNREGLLFAAGVILVLKATAPCSGIRVRNSSLAVREQCRTQPLNTGGDSSHSKRTLNLSQNPSAADVTRCWIFHL